MGIDFKLLGPVKSNNEVKMDSDSRGLQVETPTFY